MAMRGMKGARKRAGRARMPRRGAEYAIRPPAQPRPGGRRGRGAEVSSSRQYRVGRLGRDSEERRRPRPDNHDPRIW
eukprot:4070681-Prymnesium_polylepis.1